MKKGYVKLANPNIQLDSIVDGEGIRSVIWFQGCSHNCPGCHNPETHDFNSGFEVSIDEMKKKIDHLEYQTGVTFSGGDPMMQIEALEELAKHVHECGMNVWCYTGYTYEMMLTNPKMRRLLSQIDVLVDGKFIQEEKSYDIYFRGSRNQRIIDVPKSLKEEKVVLVDKYMEDKNYNETYKKPDYLFI